ncbi:type III secretion system HrpP C-terminal domain-containing protein [Erwinia sp. HDF1-3R]|uniref:type III secretion system HrpP C-terminal domain-containing protein n=1 Tax=Erwinia sp. HDF1-3R TaxID=3141543 RepID=UPI0031F4AF6C
MIRTLSQSAIAHQLRQASERQAQQQRENQRRAQVHPAPAGRTARPDARAARLPEPAAGQKRGAPSPASRSQERAASGRPASRSEFRRPSEEEDDLFSALLEKGDDVMMPLLTLNGGGSDPQQNFTPMAETATPSAPPAMALWQEIEPALASSLTGIPPGEMMLTLMLPKLGNVDAQMAALPGGGWDIALRLESGAWQALLPHQERCRLSLRQRMACRVRLRVERRQPDDYQAIEA